MSAYPPSGPVGPAGAGRGPRRPPGRAGTGGKEGVAPPGWPPSVPPPGVPGWERRAAAWLFDLCPPDHRGHDVLVRWPVLLARAARESVEAGRAAAAHGMATARAELRDVVPPEAVAAMLGMYEREGARLAESARAVALVEQALRGERFAPRL